MIRSPLSSDDKERIALKRDEAVFKAYFIANYKVFERYAFRFLQDKYLAEEVASDAMWKMWHLGEDLNYVEHVESYLYSLIKNKCLNILRVRRPTFVDLHEIENHDDESLNPEHILIDRQARQRIELAIANLPDKTQQAFLLVKLEKMSYKDVAEHMKISIKTVDRHIQNAIQKLFKALKR